MFKTLYGILSPSQIPSVSPALATMDDLIPASCFVLWYSSLSSMHLAHALVRSVEQTILNWFAASYKMGVSNQVM